MKLLVLVLLVIAVTSNAQKPARIGPDGKPLLNRPILEECKKRISHVEWGGHNYFLSWREPWHKFEDWDWFNGRNFCRDRCMDLVSFDTPGEFETFAKIMAKDNITSVYTSGRKCNFRGKGCDASHLQPILQNGWFWAGASNTRIPDTQSNTPNTFWSFTGETNTKQPDNWEGLKEGAINTDFEIGVTIEGLQEFHDEACLAILNNQYNDGIAWHDVACHFRSVIICEDSQQLMDLVQSQNGEDVSKTVNVSDKKAEIQSIIENEVEPLFPSTVLEIQQRQRHEQQQQQQQQRHRGQFNRPQGGFRQQQGFKRPPRHNLPPRNRRPNNNNGGGFLGALGLRNPFPFIF